MKQRTKLKIGTRGSALALRQAAIVKELLIDVVDDIEIIPITTTGDNIKDKNLDEFGGKGLFTKEIEEALLDKRIDIAVHSMKDVSTILPDKLLIPCMLPREDVRDAFISHIAPDLMSLPQGVKFGTSSLRRAAQVLQLRPDLEIVNFRGNVDTRLRKLEAGIADATLLACAGLIRGGNQSAITQIFDTETILPAVAQGALGIQCREDNAAVLELLRPLNHQETFDCVTVERIFLRALDGSCRMPIAGLARIEGEMLHFEGFVAARDGSLCHREKFSCNVNEACSKAQQLGTEMKGKINHAA